MGNEYIHKVSIRLYYNYWSEGEAEVSEANSTIF